MRTIIALIVLLSLCVSAQAGLVANVRARLKERRQPTPAVAQEHEFCSTSELQI
jgi:hypothetical protein